MDISRFNGLRSNVVSLHSYSRCWVHLIWGTLNRERLLNNKAAAGLSRYLAEYADEHGMYMKINFGNPDHVHVLIDLPTALSIEKVVQVLKGSSSHWVNSSEVVTGRFAWGRVRGVLGVTVKRGSGGAIHRRSGRAPLRAHIRGGTARIYRSSRIALARCGKPLKRLATCSDARSPV